MPNTSRGNRVAAGAVKRGPLLSILGTMSDRLNAPVLPLDAAAACARPPCPRLFLWIALALAATAWFVGLPAPSARAAGPPALERVARVYTILPGDTIDALARRFRVSRESILWNNLGLSDAALAPGRTLQIPRADGIIYRVRLGDTLRGIARRHGVAVRDILDYEPNGIPWPRALQRGRVLLVPRGKPPDGDAGAAGYALTTDRLNLRRGPSTARGVITVMDSGVVIELLGSPTKGFYPVRYQRHEGWASAAYLELLSRGDPRASSANVAPGTAGAFAWPATGPITSRFGPAHPLGIDIGLPLRTPVVAARHGMVIFAGGDPCCSYGLYVIVRHDAGYTTTYGHLSEILVEAGQAVVAGQAVGLSGDTGHSTGPHLHFEIRRDGVPLDPLLFLPPE